MQQRDDDRRGHEPSRGATEIEQPEVALGPDLRRRRLVRGAAAMVPVIVTLRSGGVAASSGCAPVKLVTGTNGSGKLDSTIPGLSTTDTCFTNVTPSTTPSGTVCVQFGTASGNVSFNNGDNAFCAGAASQNSVHIVSATSVCSLTGC